MDVLGAGNYALTRISDGVVTNFSDFPTTVSVSVASSRGSALGAHQVNATATKDHVGGALTATTDGTAGNNVAADAAFNVTGPNGTFTIFIAADATAAKIASQINGESATTGVSAAASNTVTLDTLAAAGTISFTLKSQDESQATVGTAASISATVSATTDLSALRDAINAETANTGITATLSTSGNVEAGGQIAQNLADLYDYAEQELLLANLRHDGEKLAAVKDIMQTLKIAWDDVSDAG